MFVSLSVSVSYHEYCFRFLKNVTSVSDPVLNSKNKDIFLSTLASTPRGSEIILDWIIETLT